MQLQQTDTSAKRDAMTGGLRLLVRELIREPVKEAVREALREEAAVRPSEGSGGSAMSGEKRSSSNGDGSGGISLGLVVLGLAAAAGVTYMARKRRSGTKQSTWSEFDEQSASGRESTAAGESAEYGRESDASEQADTAAGESSASATE